MKNIRSKISGFPTSEDRRVSTKALLALGVATGSVLLAQMMTPSPADAHLACNDDADCQSGQVCVFWAELHWPGPVVEWHSECNDPGC